MLLVLLLGHRDTHGRPKKQFFILINMQFNYLKNEKHTAFSYTLDNFEQIMLHRKHQVDQKLLVCFFCVKQLCICFLICRVVTYILSKHSHKIFFYLTIILPTNNKLYGIILQLWIPKRHLSSNRHCLANNSVSTWRWQNNYAFNIKRMKEANDIPGQKVWR